jgi:hypothetical protein
VFLVLNAVWLEGGSTDEHQAPELPRDLRRHRSLLLLALSVLLTDVLGGFGWRRVDLTGSACTPGAGRQGHPEGLKAPCR